MTDFKKILEELGYRLKDHGSYWRTNALYRSGDNTSALQIYKDTGVWKDFVEDTDFLPFQILLEKTLNTRDTSIIKSYLNNNTLNTLSRPIQKKLLKEEKTYSDESLKVLLPHLFKSCLKQNPTVSISLLCRLLWSHWICRCTT